MAKVLGWVVWYSDPKSGKFIPTMESGTDTPDMMDAFGYSNETNIIRLFMGKKLSYLGYELLNSIIEKLDYYSYKPLER